MNEDTNNYVNLPDEPEFASILSLTFAGNPEALKEYWRSGPGADKINWQEEDGNLSRCHGYLIKYMTSDEAWGFCERRHEEIFGESNRSRDAKRENKQLALLSLTAANDCHEANSGRFCSGTGSKAGTTQPTATAKSKIRNKRYFTADPRAAEAVEALDAIESVHQLPADMPDVFFSLQDDPSGPYGFYQPGKRNSDGVTTGLGNITIDHTRNHQQLTAAHEFGHFIDHKANLLDEGDWGTLQAGQRKMDALFDAVKATPQYDTLRELKYQGDEEERQRATYMLNDKEVFARAYAQYIGVRSGNKAIQNQAKQIADSGDDDIIFASGHWTPEQFTPIAKAMDQIFQHRGLLNPEHITASAILTLTQELEFANPCHDENGRFCETPTGTRVPSRGGPEFSQKVFAALKPKRSWTTSDRQKTLDALKEIGPEAVQLGKTLTSWQQAQGGVNRLRGLVNKHLTGVKESRAADIFLAALMNQDPNNTPTKLFRGYTADNSPETLLRNFTTGSKYALEASGFSTDRGMAIEYAEASHQKRPKQTKVLVQMDGPKRAIPVQNLSPTIMWSREKEWVTQGTHKIIESKQIGDTIHLLVEQEDIL